MATAKHDNHVTTHAGRMESPPKEEVELPPKPRRTGGWAEDFGKDKGKRKRDHVEEDERLKVHEDSDEDELPIIPDLEDMQDEQLAGQVAAPPSVAVTRVATFKQLDSDLHKHAGLFTLDGEVDLKPLARVLSPEQDVTEADKPWEWNKLFAELSSDIQEVWDRRGGGENAVTVTPSVMSMDSNLARFP